MPGVAVADRRIDQQHAAMGCAQRYRRLSEQSGVAAEDRGGQRPASTPRQANASRLIAIRYDGCYRAKNLKFVDDLAIGTAVQPQQRWGNECTLLEVGIDGSEVLRRRTLSALCRFSLRFPLRPTFAVPC